MNCIEVRNDFVAFWQKTLTDDQRAQLLAHLRRCASCDRSFRSFALTAPVLYSVSEPEWDSAVIPARPLRTASFDEPGRSRAEYQRPVQRLSRALPAAVMAAAAVIALYFAAPGPVTFEDAIAADNPNMEVTAYPSTDSLFGQEVIAQNSVSQVPVDE
jgi:hypothetical protein